MRVDEIQRWTLKSESDTSHFCKRSNRKCQDCSSNSLLLKWGDSIKIFVITVIILCNHISPIQSLAVRGTTSSPVGDGFIKGFLSGSKNSSENLSNLDDKSLSGVPKPKPTFPTRISSSQVKSGRRRNVDTSEVFSSISEEDKKKILQIIPETLFAQRFSEAGRREIRDRARFLVGSLSRQNCFSKVICGLGARPPSTKTDLLNDYVYLMNDLLVDDDKSGEQGKATGPTAETVLKFRDDSSFSTSSQQETGSKKSKDKKKKFPYLKNDSDEDLETLVEDDYNPLLAQMADEELVPDDPAILKFMELEMKKRLKHRPPPGPPPPPYRRPSRPRYKRNAIKDLKGRNATTNQEEKSSAIPANDNVEEGRAFTNKGRRKKAQKEFLDQGRFLMEPPMNALDARQFISKRRLELRNEKDFKKRLSLAADAGRTLRNRRQCRLLFDDCPLDDKQIDSIVVGLKRVMDAGNLAAVLPPTTTLAPEAQAVVDAVKKTVASTQATHTASAPPGSKVEIILHLNQNGMPYATQTQGGSYPATAYVQSQYPNMSSIPSQMPPPQVLPYIPPSVGMPPIIPEMFTTTTTTTPRPVAEEQLLDFLYGVVNFNSTSETPLMDFDWSGTGSAPIKPLKDRPMKHRPASTMDISEYLEKPLKLHNKDDGMIFGRDPIFDNSEELSTKDKNAGLLGSALGAVTEGEELNALKDYLASLKETLIGIAQMNNASLATEADIFGKSSEESKESVNDSTKESDDDDFFEISTGNKNKGGAKESEEEEDEILGEDKEVLLKLKGAKNKRKQKQKKKGGKRTTTTERYDLQVDDEKDNEDDGGKIFDDDDSDNEEEKVPPKKSTARPAKKRPNQRPQHKRPGQGNLKTTNKKKKKPEQSLDDEDEVKEVPTDEIINNGDEEEDEEYEDEEEDEEDEEESGAEEEGEEEYEESGEEEEEEEEDDDEEEGRSKDKESPLSSAVSSIGSSLNKPDPTKITLIFAPSGTGADKLGDLHGDEDMTSEEKQKLAALTEVLLPTAPAPPPLSPKKPIEDPDDKPVVPAAPPVHREFQKIANFVSNTKIVNISDFDENNPTHPKFHKKYKKRPSYRNPAAKKKKAQALAKAQAALHKRPFGRPVGAPHFRPPPPRRPPYGPPRDRPKPGDESASKEQAQDDVGTSRESGSSEEEENGEEGEVEEDGREGEDGDAEEDERDGEEENRDGDEADTDHPEDDVEEKPAEDNESGANDDTGDDEPEQEVEFGPGRVPLPGPGPPGIGRLPPKSRDGMDKNDEKQTSGENTSGQELTKTLIAVPYFRQGTETKYVEGPPPIGGGISSQNTFGKFFVNMMGMKQVTTDKPVDDSPDYPPYFGIPPHQRNRQKPYSVTYSAEEKDTSVEIKSVEDETASTKNETIESRQKPTKLDVAADGENPPDSDIPPKQFKATITVDTTNLKGEIFDDDDFDSPAYDIDEPQDDKKGKKKGKKKKKKKKKKKHKKKKKKKGALVSQMHWKAGNPSLFIESGNADGLFNQLKKYVADTVGTVLYLPPEEQANIPPVVLSDLPPDESHTTQVQVVPPAVPHFNVPIPWDDDDDDDDSDECKGKGKGKKKGKKKKKKGRREGRKKKKKKKKKKKGSKEESCEASSEEDWDDDDDDDKKGDKKDGDKKDGDKKDGGKKKDGEKRDDLLALSDIIERVDTGKLVIDPSVSPTEFYSRTSTEASVFGRFGGKSTLAPRPTRYKITKRPRTPKPATPRPVIINTSFDGISGNQTLFYRPAPTPAMNRKPSLQVEGNIGVPIELFTTSTQRTTTPRLELTTLKHLVPKPTRRKLQYKNPNRRQSNRPRKPMIGTVYTSQIRELTTPKPKPKEDDEHEPASVHFQPMPGGHYIKNQAPPSIDKFHTLSADMLEKEEDDYYRDEESDSRELRGRRPLLDIDKILPFRRKQERPGPTPSAKPSSYQIITNRLKGSILGLTGNVNKQSRPHENYYIPSNEKTNDNEERKEEDLNNRGSNSKGKKRKQRPSGNHHHQHHHVHPHHQPLQQPPLPPTAPGTTGLQALKNFNIRNLLSKYGNSLLDKTISLGR